MRQQGERDDDHKGQQDPHGTEPSRPLGGNGKCDAGLGQVCSANGNFPGDVNRGADRQHDDHQGIRNRVLGDLRDVEKDLYGRDRVVVEHERRAELAKAPDEDDRAAREQSRPHARQCHRPENPPGRGAQVGGGLLHGGVQVGQSRGNVQKEYRVETQRLGNDDREELVSGQPVDRCVRWDQAQGPAERRQRPACSENLPQPDRTDKGRQNQRHQQQ